MNLGPKKKAELVERAKQKWDEMNPGQLVCSEIWKNDIAAIVTLVLAECESRVAPLVRYMDELAKCGWIVPRDVMAAYRASLADEPEPKEPTWRLAGWPGEKGWTIFYAADGEHESAMLTFGQGRDFVNGEFVDNDLVTPDEARAIFDAFKLAREREKRS